MTKKPSKTTNTAPRQRKSNSASASLALRHQRQADKLKAISARVTSLEALTEDIIVNTPMLSKKLEELSKSREEKLSSKDLS